jgi:hypothetical protein
MTAQNIYDTSMSFTSNGISEDYAAKVIPLINVCIALLYPYNSSYLPTNAPPRVTALEDEIQLDERLQQLIPFSLGAFLLAKDDTDIANYLEQKFNEGIIALKQTKVDLAKSDLDEGSFLKEKDLLDSKYDLQKETNIKGKERLSTVTAEVAATSSKFDYEKENYAKQKSKLANTDAEIAATGSKLDYEKESYIKQKARLTTTDAEIAANLAELAYSKAYNDKRLAAITAAPAEIEDIPDAYGGFEV